MTDNELLEQFEDLTLQAESFDHREHVRLAWVYLKKYPLMTAISKFCEGLKRFATFHGKPDRYHETITWAYLLLIRERIARDEKNESWEEFAGANGDLLDFKTSILTRYYLKDTLQSDLARKVFLFPNKVSAPEQQT